MVTTDNELLKVHPDTVITIRKLYNLDKPGDMDKAIDVLEDWLKKQHHLTKRDYSRDFLERSIIFMKGSVERAKRQIENLSSLRTIFPKFYEKYDAKNDLKLVDSYLLSAMLPKLTSDHYRVFVSYIISKDLTPEVYMEAYRFGIMKAEYLKAHDYCNGFIAILDYRNASIMNLLSAVDWIATNQLVCLLLEGYGMRTKGVHILTPSKAVDTMVRILRPMLGSKVSNRLYVHTNIDTLYDHVEKNVLPSELGGDEESMVVLTERWKEVLGREENVKYLREMSQAVSKEAYKKDLNFSYEGTFRSLSVD